MTETSSTIQHHYKRLHYKGGIVLQKPLSPKKEHKSSSQKRWWVGTAVRKSFFSLSDTIKWRYELVLHNYWKVWWYNTNL